MRHKDSRPQLAPRLKASCNAVGSLKPGEFDQFVRRNFEAQFLTAGGGDGDGDGDDDDDDDDLGSIHCDHKNLTLGRNIHAPGPVKEQTARPGGHKLSLGRLKVISVAASNHAMVGAAQ